MSGAGERMTGSCLCGAVRFVAAPKTREVGACHCSMCRRWTAGPFLGLECGSAVEIADKSQLGAYRSSQWAERMFCKQCGTPLFYWLIDKNAYFVSAEAFDDQAGFVFATQTFIDEKPAYYEFANKTHNMTGAEVFALFAPSSEGQAQS
jgi:hypothetical protein